MENLGQGSFEKKNLVPNVPPRTGNFGIRRRCPRSCPAAGSHCLSHIIFPYLDSHYRWLGFFFGIYLYENCNFLLC